MGNLNFTTDQVQQRLAQGYYDDIKAAGYTGTKAQLDTLLAKAGIVMKAATAEAAGEAGLVPAPGTGAQTKYLRGDGTWQTTPDSVYTHPTTAGNKHIPSGGVAGQFLKWSADGTAVWAADNNTTYAAMKAATASIAGTAGLVPAPPAGAQTKYLRGDGTWAEAAGGGGNSCLDLSDVANLSLRFDALNGTLTQEQFNRIIAASNNGTTTLKINDGSNEDTYLPMYLYYTIDSDSNVKTAYNLLVNMSTASTQPNNYIMSITQILGIDINIATKEWNMEVIVISQDIKNDTITIGAQSLTKEGMFESGCILRSILAGATAPTASAGKNGDIYIQY